MLVRQFVRNLRQVRLRLRHKQIFGLCPVDRVAKTPAANGFEAVPMSALSELTRQAGAALSTWRNRADQNSVADFITGNAVTELFDYPNRFVANNQTGAHRIFAAHNMEIRAANCRQRDSNNGLADSRMRARHFFDSDISGSAENRCSH